MGKRGNNWQPRPSTTQSGVLNYGSLTAKKRRLSSKTKRRRALARDLARQRDAVRQAVDEENRVNFDAVKQLLDKGMTLKEAKRLSCNI
jgi:hypothetical protein